MMASRMLHCLAGASLLAAAAPVTAMQMTVFGADGSHRRISLEPAGAHPPQMVVLSQGDGQAHRSIALPSAMTTDKAPLAVFRTEVAPTATPGAGEPLPRVESRLYIEAREDATDWRIGVPGVSPEVISELSWEGLRSAGLR
jgi:hypothetical protein